MKRLRWVADPVELASDPGIDAFVELIGGDGNPARARGRRGAARPASPWSPPTRRCWRGTASSWRRSPRSTRSRSTSRPRSAAASRSSRRLREGLAGNAVARIYGILNGTCNYILTRMERERLSFDECLKEAQRLGYAEADPSFDIEGHDTAQKLSILASLAFGIRVDPAAIYVEGITSITTADLEAAEELGYRIKLLGVAVKTDKGIEQRVHPTMVRKDSAIAQVMDVTNAVTIDAEGIPPITLVGPGAGGMATASAVVADIADIARGVRAAPFGRAVGEAQGQQEGADAAPRGRLLHPHAGGGQARHRRHHRQAPRAAQHFDGIDRAAAPRPAGRRRGKGQGSGARHTDHLRHHRGCGAKGAWLRCSATR